MERYKIIAAQIYSITCDHARNMVIMVDLFNSSSEEDTIFYDETEENDDNMVKI